MRAALEIAVEAEESAGYAEYLNTEVREFLEAESSRAQEAHHEYLVELFIESLG